MAFIALDKDFNTVNILNPLNIQWRRKYYEFGTYEIQLIATDYKDTMKYVFNSNTKEIAFINKVDYKLTSTGSFILLDGYFIEFYLTRCSTEFSTTNTNIEKICRDIVQELFINRANLDYYNFGLTLTMGQNHNYKETIDGVSADLAEVGTKLQDILKYGELSQRILYDQTTNKLSYEVYKGLDRTQSQSSNTYCTFSESLGNVTNVDYSNDDSNYKNVCYVLYPNWDYTLIEMVDNRKSMSDPVYEIHYDGSSLQKQSDEAVMHKLMHREGLLQLLNHYPVENLTFDVIPYKYTYLKDFDLGDKIDIYLDTIKKAWSARITGITEVYKNNTQTLSIQVGEPKKMNYNKGGIY